MMINNFILGVIADIISNTYQATSRAYIPFTGFLIGGTYGFTIFIGSDIDRN